MSALYCRCWSGERTMPSCGAGADGAAGVAGPGGAAGPAGGDGRAARRGRSAGGGPTCGVGITPSASTGFSGDKAGGGGISCGAGLGGGAEAAGLDGAAAGGPVGTRTWRLWQEPAKPSNPNRKRLSRSRSRAEATLLRTVAGRLEHLTSVVYHSGKTKPESSPFFRLANEVDCPAMQLNDAKSSR